VVSRYHAHLGSSLLQMALRLVPATVRALLDYKRIVFLLHLLVPTALISTLAPSALLVGALAFLGIILADDVSKYSVVLGHQAVLIPVVMAATAYGMRKAVGSERLSGWLGLGQNQGSRRDAANFLAVLLLTSALLSSYYFGVTPWSRKFPKETFALTPRAGTVHTIKQMIPREASVAATHRLAAHFTDQEDLFYFPWKHDRQNYKKADWVIIDFHDDWADKQKLGAIARELSVSGAYEVEAGFQKQGFLIFKRKGDTRPKASADEGA